MKENQTSYPYFEWIPVAMKEMNEEVIAFKEKKNKKYPKQKEGVALLISKIESCLHKINNPRHFTWENISTDHQQLKRTSAEEEALVLQLFSSLFSLSFRTALTSIHLKTL